MCAELIQDENTQRNDYPFALQEEFTNNHQINLVLEEKHKQIAIFVIQSCKSSSNPNDNRLIDSVTFLKLVVAADDNLTQKQVTITLPSKQVNTNVICTPSNNKDCIDCYCFFQNPDLPSVVSCKLYTLFISSFNLHEGKIINDVVRDVLGVNKSMINVNVFRFKKSLDDASLLFWRPYAIKS